MKHRQQLVDLLGQHRSAQKEFQLSLARILWQLLYNGR